MIAAVTDTHPFLWYVSGQENRLGRKAIRLFQAAERGDGSGIVYIPTIVLAEALFLIQSGSIRITQRFDHWVRDLDQHDGFNIVDLTIEMVIRATNLPTIPNPFDQLITASALYCDLPLVTDDYRIRVSNLVEIFWED